MGGGFFSESSIRCGYMENMHMRVLQWMQNWLEAFLCVCVWSGALWANRWKEATMCQNRPTRMRKKTLLVGTEGKNPGYASKQSREEDTLLGWWLRSVSSKDTATQNSQGKILLPQRQRWSRERGNLGIHVRWTVLVRVNLSCLEGRSTVLPRGTGLWRNITCCEQCRWGCCQGTMWKTGTNQSNSSLCICSGGWVITIHHQPDWCVNSGDSCFRERGQLLMPFNSRK